MNITSIIKQKKNPERYNIYVDNNFTFTADIEDVVKYGIKEGREITPDELNLLIETCEGTKAYNFCLYILSRRDYTEFELGNKLRQKLYSKNTIEKTLEKLRRYDIINDERYIKKYINDSQKFKKHGKRKIIFNLDNKGVSEKDLENINSNINVEMEYQNALDLASKKLNMINQKDNKRERLYSYLASRGYEYDVIKKVLSEIMSNCESDDYD